MNKKSINLKRNIVLSPYGIETNAEKLKTFHFWAPDASDVKLCIGPNKDSLDEIPMKRDDNGLCKTTIKASKNALYGYKIDNNLIVPDPASNYQPYDVHGLSQIVSHEDYDWEEDEKWTGQDWEKAIIYELHPGTFTEEGTFKAIENKLDHLVSLGVTAIELMPVADFPGKRNWGYDGVLIYAPDSSYGTPDDLKNLIKAAHKKGLMVFLDVVYNHFGPDGNYLYVYAKSKFFNHDCTTPWGDAINFDNEYVRNFFINNAIHWLKDYHFDGLRLDAVHSIYDNKTPDILEELSERVREAIGTNRKIHLVLENDNNCSRYLEPEKNGYYEAQWNDDFHHCAHILSTGEKEGYYVDYTKEKTKSPTSYYIARILSEGFAYQGEKSFYREDEIRGEKSSHLPPTSFVNFIQNHDQIGNRAFGERISSLTDIERLKAIVSLYLLSPAIPLLFMGEEWGSKTPFYFFCNFNEELSKAVRKGRREEFSKFPEFEDPKVRELIPDPSNEETFLKSKLDWADLKNTDNKAMLDYYKSILNIRKKHIIPLIKQIKKSSFKTINDKAFTVEWELNCDDKNKLIVISNLGETPIQFEYTSDLELLDISNIQHKKTVLEDKIVPKNTVIWLVK